jgi:hypothetical protein
MLNDIPIQEVTVPYYDRGMPEEVAQFLETLRAYKAGNVTLPEGAPSWEAVILSTSGLLVNPNVHIVPDERAGKKGFSLMARLGVFLTPKDVKWAADEFIKQQGRLGPKPTEDHE